VSVTDLKGRITYCNAAFVTASGYSQAELLGQPHNLVRHPDMPEEAFRDLWATIESGHPWQGVVKNRRKNGDHYWVMANATPMRDGDRIVGYLSVRMAPSRAQIDACQALYARMQDEARGQRLRTGLRAGSVMRLDPVGRVAGALISALGRWGLDGMAPLAAAAGTGLAASLAGPVVWVPTAIVLATGAWALVRWRRETALQSLLGDALRLAAGDLRQLRSAPQHGRMGELQLGLSQTQREPAGHRRRAPRSRGNSWRPPRSPGQPRPERRAPNPRPATCSRPRPRWSRSRHRSATRPSFAEQAARMAAGHRRWPRAAGNAASDAVKAHARASAIVGRIGEIIG
jgi:PAS domain S-box-containing protein